MERARPSRPEGKPSNWWAKEKEPWKRVSADVMADQDRRQAEEKIEATVLSVSVFAEAAMGLSKPEKMTRPLAPLGKEIRTQEVKRPG